jgi:hypothetical protein
VSFRREPFNYCAAVNAGAAVAGGDLWIVANNDLVFRSGGDLGRLERLFRAWPILGAASPGRRAGAAEIEFRRGGINGACWSVRPAAFRSWGGMPEAMSGYGFDEAYTQVQLTRGGWCFAWVTGWDVHHYGSATFGPEAGNVTPALRRNLSRMLRLLGADDLDQLGSPRRIVHALNRREEERAPCLLEAPFASKREVAEQGCAFVAARCRWEKCGHARVRRGSPADSAGLQWAPWLLNELALQPSAGAVGRPGLCAVRPGPAADLPPRAVGPPPPPVMPRLRPGRPGIRACLAAWRHAWRHRGRVLPEEW